MNRLMQQGLVLGLVVSALVAGCGPREVAKQTTYPTTGVLRFHGEPASFVKITLTSANDPPTPAAEGYTDGEGRFNLRTYSNTEPDGAVEGTYTVEVEPHDNLRPGQTPTKIPDELKKTGKTVEVKSEDNDLTIDLP